MSVKDILPCFPKAVRGNVTVLKTDPKRTHIIYAVDRTIVIRPLADPKRAQLYTQHGYPVTAVEMAPSCCYVASGDSVGKVRIWGCDNPEQPLKIELEMLGGPIKDLAWSGDSQRLLGVGDGRELFAKVVMWDSGNSVGDVAGHTKVINTCSFKPTRPFRLITGSDDKKVNLYSGPPFKFTSTPKSHANFVNCVRFSPDGERFFSVSSDMYLSVFESKEGALICEEKAHAGTIYAAAWSPDSTKILTASADKSVKVFDAATLKELTTFGFEGKSLDFMQVGCAWMADTCVSYALSGALSFLDPSAPAAPVKVEWGHNETISTFFYDAGLGKLFSGSFESGTGTVRGCVRAWDLTSGTAQPVTGTGHTNNVMGIGLCDGSLVTCGLDDAVCFSDPSALAFGTKVPVGGSPRGFAIGGSLAAVVTAADKLVLLRNQKVEKDFSLGFMATGSVAISGNGSLVAVGSEGEGENAVHVLTSGCEKKLKLMQHRAGVSALAFAPDGVRLASGCKNKELVVWDATNGTMLVKGLGGFHAATITQLAWSAAGVLASAGVDAQIIVWNIEEKTTKHKIRLAHASGGVTALTFVDEGTLASGGQDAVIKLWNVA